MNPLMSLLGGGNIVKDVGDALDNLFTSDEERMEAKLEVLRAERAFDAQIATLTAQQNIAQTEVNKQEAKGNWFQAGWRPAIGWVGALAMLYQFLVYPALLWLLDDMAKAPPAMQADELYVVITGMLGIAGMRSLDKIKGVSR